MPTYEYACATCGHQWEEIQKISEAALTDCPECKKATAKRLISGGSFILKGGGWYSDLYSSAKPGKKDGGGGDAGGGSSGSSSGSGGDAKAETKSEPKSEAPKGDAPKGDAPKGDAPKGDKKPASGSAAA